MMKKKVEGQNLPLLGEKVSSAQNPFFLFIV